jgi:hypothetical protein
MTDIYEDIRIEAQAAEIETMVPRDVAETWKAKAENLSAALKATAASNAEYLKTVVGLKEEIERLREALEFYAGWGVTNPVYDTVVILDGGDKARAALGETE